MSAMQDRETKYNEEKKLFSCLVDLLSYEKITFNGELSFSTNFKTLFMNKGLAFIRYVTEKFQETFEI